MDFGVQWHTRRKGEEVARILARQVRDRAHQALVRQQPYANDGMSLM